MVHYLISSTSDYCNTTIPIVIPSLLESGISPESIRIYVGDSSIEQKNLWYGCNTSYVKHNSYDYTSIIEYANEPDQADWFFMLHDTVIVEKKFKQIIENFNKSYDAVYLRHASINAVCNFAMYSKKLLTVKYDEIMSLKNCTKIKAIESEGFLIRGINAVGYSGKDSDAINIDNNVNPYGGISRITEYYHEYGLIKFKANWGQSVNYTSKL